jgi:hypothetical protein
LTQLTEIKKTQKQTPKSIKELLDRATKDINDPDIVVTGLAIVVVTQDGGIFRGFDYERRRFEMLGAIQGLKEEFVVAEILEDE